MIKSPKLKIIVLGTRGFPNIQGGVEKHCQQLYPQLVKAGYEVTVLAREPYVGRGVREYKGVKIVPLSCSKNKFFEAFGHTFKGVFAAKRMGCDILHFHAIGPSIFVPLARFLGLKVVMTNHGRDYERKKWNRVAKRILKTGERWGSRWANEVICISESIAQVIRNKFNRKVAVIPNGVVIPKVLESNQALKQYGLEKGKYILAVGRFVPEKGFHDLIRAYTHLRTSNYKLLTSIPKLVIVGDADHADKYSKELRNSVFNLQSPISNLPSSNSVILTGFLTGKPLEELYSHAGLFVLSSYHEGLPIALLEAMSYGLSCVASDIPANKEVNLSENRFFKAGDISGIAAKIEEFINNPLTEEERKKQIEMTAARYNWQNIADKTMKIYQNISKIKDQKSKCNAKCVIY